MSGSIKIRGVAELSAHLAQGIERQIPAVLRACANTTQNALAVYPPAPARGQRRQWWQRGYGPRWLRKNGSIGGRKISELLNRRWSVEGTGSLITLENAASYAKWVHSAKDQSARLAAIGWKTDETVTNKLEANGTYKKIAETALKALLKG